MAANDPPPSPGSQTHITGDMYGPVLSGTFTGPVDIHLPPLAQVLHQLRAPVGDFVGRTDEIVRLVIALRAASRGGSVAAITGVRGLGGIGKTELAYTVAHAVMADFPDAQIVVALGGAGKNPLTPAQALQTVIRAFEREAKLPEDVEQLQTIYTGLLSGKQALILADDAKDAAQVRPLLPPSGCALLITSRTHFSLPGMQAIDLGVLSEVEATALLGEICPRIGADAAALAKLCGFLPLALRISASLLRDNPARLVARYLEQLQAARLAYLVDPDDPAVSVEASLSLSYDALSEAAQSALTQLSVFPTDFYQAAALGVVQAGTEIEATLELLVRRSLLEWRADAERYVLHDLVRVFAAARLVDAEAARLRHAQHYQVVANQAFDLYLKGRDAVLAGLALFDRERVNIDTGWAWAMEWAGGLGADQLLLGYASATAFIGVLRYDTRLARIPQLEAQRDAARRLGQRDDEGSALGNLGLAYRSLGDIHKANEFHKHSLAISREVSDRFAEGADLGNLGNTYYVLGDTAKAMEYYEQRLAIAREIDDRQGEGNAFGNLGNAYHVLGDTAKAMEYYEQALAIKRKIGDLHGEGKVLGNLGLVYADLGHTHKAIDHHKQALAITREIGDRQGEAKASWNLGLVYEQGGDIARAVKLMQACVDFEHEVGHPDAEQRAHYVAKLRQRLQQGTASATDTD